MKTYFSITFILIIFFGELLSQVNLDSGLVAYYPFNGNADDSSGYNNHGTIHGATLTQNRFNQPNKAYSFNGTDNYISIDSYSNMSPQISLSITAWIKTADTSNTRASIYDRLETHDGFGLIVDSLGYPYLSLNGGDIRLSSLVDVDDTLWHFIACTYSLDSANIKIYIDGYLSNSINYSDSIDYNPEPRNQIGRTKTGENYFHGSIDEIRIYDRQLTQNEIDTLYDNFVSIQDKNSRKILESFVLQQNYPNPFNPITNIQFTIPKTEYVTLKIYNLLGQEVATLVSDQLTAGNYTYTWDASGFASSVYIYKLETEIGFEKSKKLILLR